MAGPTGLAAAALQDRREPVRPPMSGAPAALDWAISEILWAWKRHRQRGGARRGCARPTIAPAGSTWPPNVIGRR